MPNQVREFRGFIAIELPPAVKSFLQRVASQLRNTGGDVKWVRVEGMHLTLKFLGQIRSDLVPEIDGSVGPVFRHLKPFELQVSGIGAFPNLGRPKVFWAGIKDAANALGPLAAEVDRRLVKLGFEMEKRPFSPHLTLGRVRSSARMRDLVEAVREDMEIAGPIFVANHAILFESVLKPSGAEYFPVSRYDFAGS